MRYIKKIVGVLFLLIGIAIFLSPDIQAVKFYLNCESVIKDFQSSHPGISVNVTDRKNDSEDPGASAESNITDNTPAYDAFYEECAAYNKKICENKQADLVDPFSVTGIPTGLSTEDDLFGYIEIPAMDLSMPLYIGADNGNLAKGAAILSQTSMPIGGQDDVSANSVIAGHRGYQGIPYFREIEKLQVGDKVYITNQWEKLTYQVTSIAIINPNDIESILIQEGRNMVTLMTCHPYRSGGKYRYVVYCDRIPNEESTNETDAVEQSDITNKTGEAYTPSQDEIDQERILRLIGGGIIIICLFYLFLPRRRKI